MGTNLSRWDVACARKVGMKNKVCRPKDTCMKMNLGRWDVAFARKVGMKNKVCGPKDTCMSMNLGRREHCMRLKSWYEK